MYPIPNKTFDILVGKKAALNMQFKKAGNFITDKLKKELSANYVYHNLDHTLDVYQAAERIGNQENINPYEMKLLLTAAAYHDSGFLRVSTGHEEESCRIAATALPGFGYTENEVNIICSMIRATRIPQSPKTLLERILADADLDYLGRDDFFEIAHRLFTELKLSGVVNDEAAWNRIQLDFITNHTYFTESAINLRRPKMLANIAQIRIQILNQATT
jgi:uncharacterized protein